MSYAHLDFLRSNCISVIKFRIDPTNFSAIDMDHMQVRYMVPKFHLPAHIACCLQDTHSIIANTLPTDLFHENKPSIESLYQTIALLREYVGHTDGEAPVSEQHKRDNLA